MLGREACLQNLVGGSNKRMRNKYEGPCQPRDSGSNPQPRQRERENDKLYQTNPGGGAGLIDSGSDQWLCGSGGEKWNPPIISETNKRVALRVGCAADTHVIGVFKEADWRRYRVWLVMLSFHSILRTK